MSSATNLNPTLGAIEIGTLLSVFLFGLTTLQTWLYFQRYSDDRVILKSLVGAVWLIELTTAICAVQGLYTLTVTDFGNPEKLLKVPPAINLVYLLVAITGTAVQTFYSLRIKSLMRKLYIPVFCWVVSTAILSLAITTAVEGLQIPDYTTYERRAGVLADAAFILAATEDLVIALTLCYYFHSQRSSAQTQTAKVLKLLTTWTIQTGLLTSIVAVIIVITFETMQYNLVWMAFFLPYGGLYANSFLALLNGRSKVRRSLGGAVIELEAIDSSSSQSKITDIAFRPGKADESSIPGERASESQV